jgi:hypothetical protein
MSGYCPCSSENVWKMSGRMIKFAVRNFSCAERTGQIPDMDNTFKNGKIKNWKNIKSTKLNLKLPLCNK